MKRSFFAAAFLLLLLVFIAPAGASDTEDAGFYNLGSSEQVEIVPLSDSGDAVLAIARNVDGKPGDEVFYPGSSALRVVLMGTEAEKWYLLAVSAGDRVFYAEQQPGGGPITFDAAFLLPDEQTDLVLHIGSDADGFETINIPLAYTPAANASDAPEPSPGALTAVTDCPRDDDCVMAAFDDLNPAAWYHDGVHFVLASGMMQGYGEGVFSPSGTASRAMTAQILWNMEGRPEAENAVDFADVADSAWYANAVRWASGAGIITGWTDSATGKQLFAPSADVTREQFAAMLYRYAKLRGKGFEDAWTFQLDFPDAGSVSDWAYEPVCWWVKQGVINGMNGLLAPKGNATRAQVASMLFRFAFSV